jgi:hypothetical protein
MKWFERLARWVEHRGGMRELYRPHPVTGQPTLYMRRFYLAKTPFGEAMLHQFFMGDEGGLHDHPWFSFGRILAKGYREHLCEKVENGAPVGEFVVERRPGDWGWRPAGISTRDNSRGFHRVELRPGEEGQVWTLFVTGPRKTVWGFLSENGWIPFSEYFKKDGTSAKQATPDQYRGWIFPRKVA